MIPRLTYEAAVLINQSVTGNCIVRDGGALDSALHRPFQSVFGDDAYPTLMEKAAVLLHGVATSHAFFDGNKRTAWTGTVTFLGLNGVQIVDDGRAGQMVLDLVEQRQDHLPALLFLATHSA